MKNNLTEIILKYAQEENTDYALLLTGKWGCGKTYYWKNILSEEIKKISVSDDSETKLKPIYVSLNGISDVNQIVDRFLAEGDSSGFFKILKNLPKDIKTPIVNIDIGKYSSFGIQYLFTRYLKKQSQKIFICFDDLERISKKLKIEDILGFINTNFIEHNKIKTIVITDEEILLKKTSEFGEIKEKYFERTLKFEFDAEYIVGNISLNYKNSEKPFFDFLVRNKKYIVDLIIDAKIENIRTIKFALRILKDVFYTAGEKEIVKLSKEIILFTFSVSNEFKIAKIKSNEIENPKIFFNIYQYIQKFEMNEILKTSPNKDGDMSTDESFVYHDYFFKLYINQKRKSDYEYFNSIYRYILLGHFDKSIFKKEIDQILGGITNWDDAYTKLLNFRGLSDKEFRSCYKNVLKFVEKGKYSLYRYINLSVLLKSLFDSNLLEINEDELFDIINRGLEIKDSSLSNEYNEDSFSHMDLYKDFTDKNVIKIRKKVISIHNQSKNDNLENKVTKLFEVMRVGGSDLGEYYYEIASKSIISIFSAEKLFEFIKEGENSLLVSIEDFIYNHGKNIKRESLSSESIEKERIELEILLSKLINYEESLNAQSVRKYNVKKIIKSVNEILQFNHHINPPN